MFKLPFWKVLEQFELYFHFKYLMAVYTPCINYVCSQWGTSPFRVRMCIPDEAHRHSRWGTSPIPVRHIAHPGEAHRPSRWGTSPFPVRHIALPGEAHRPSRWGTSPFPESHIALPGESHRPSRRVTSPFPESHIAIPGKNVYFIVIHAHQECTFSPGMPVVPYWEYIS